MSDNFKICYQAGSGEIVEKKSRFIAYVAPAASEAEAAAFIESIQKKHWDARHNCYAYVLGERGNIYKYSDDGEPAGTAGKPMIDVLIGEGMTDTCAVVSRYFGGVLLGTGGLVRAYTEALKAGLAAAKTGEKRKGYTLSFHLDYTLFEKVKRLAQERGYFVLDTVYGEDVRLRLLLPEEEWTFFTQKLADLSLGKMRNMTGEPCFYLQDGQTVLLPEI